MEYSGQSKTANFGWLADLNLVASASTILASVAVLITACFIWRQVKIQSDARDTDIKRFKRETAVFVLNILQDGEFLSDRSKMIKYFSKQRSGSPNDSPIADCLKNILKKYEILCLSVDLGAIEEIVFKKYWKSNLINDWDKLSEFSSNERDLTSNSTLFSEVEKVAKKWKSELSASKISKYL